MGFLGSPIKESKEAVKQTIPERSPLPKPKKNLILDYLQSCRKAENRAIKSIQGHTKEPKSQTKSSTIKPMVPQSFISDFELCLENARNITIIKQLP